MKTSKTTSGKMHLIMIIENNNEKKKYSLDDNEKLCTQFDN